MATKTPSYSGLQGITDPLLKRALKILHDKLAAIEATANTDTLLAPLTQPLHGGGKRLTKVADPLENDDVVTKGWLVRAMEARFADQARRNLSTTPGTPSGGGGPTPVPSPSDNGAGSSGCSQAGATGHLSPGYQLDATSAGMIVCGTGNEYPNLLAATIDQVTRDANTAELTERAIWHLIQAGFEAGQQRNPSGVISSDKVTVKIDGNWLAYDIMTGNDYSVPNETHMNQVFPADHEDDAGTAD